MTVGELRLLLNDMPDNLPVVASYYTGEWVYADISEVFDNVAIINNKCITAVFITAGGDFEG